jgi:hypothetical protein
MPNRLDSVLVRVSESSFFRIVRNPSPSRVILPLVWIILTSVVLVYVVTHGHSVSTSNKIIWTYTTTWAFILFIDAILAYARHYLSAPDTARPYYVRLHPGSVHVIWRVLTLLNLGLLLGFTGVIIATLILLVR